MKTIQIRNITIGEGRPKICVPVVGQTEEDILRRLPDLFLFLSMLWSGGLTGFRMFSILKKSCHTAKALRSALGELPLLFTFRNAKEGGEKEISAEAYRKLNLTLAASGLVDLIDVELFSGDELVKELIREAHSHGVKVIASNHDFHKTPSKEELIHRLRLMQDFDADLPKIAVMPTCRQDVLTLLSATLEMAETYADRPIITMSMSGTGVISRLTGEFFGSALTFGAAAKASAPGQIPVSELETVLSVIHKSC